MRLSTRLSLAIAALLLLTTGLAALHVLSQARRATADEVAGMLSLGVLTLTQLQTGKAPTAAHAEAVLRQLDAARHLCVRWDGSAACSRQQAVGAPAWFARRVRSAPGIQSYRITLDDGRRIIAELRTDPADEISEAWRDARGLLAMLAGMVFASNLAVFFMVRRQLRPVGALVEALNALRQGRGPRPLPLPLGDELVAIAAGIDALGVQLRRSEADKRRLSREYQTAEEVQRRKLACELHDGLGQSLTALQADVATLSCRIPVDDAPGAAALESLRGTLGELGISLRDRLRQLRPRRLEGGDLCGALSELVAGFRRAQPQPRIRLRHGAPQPLDASTCLHVYRFVQEAVNNTQRHARARHLRICLGRDRSGAFWLMVADDGCGMAAVHDDRGYGLLHLRERAEALSGYVDIGPRRGGGTRVLLRWPEVSRA